MNLPLRAAAALAMVASGTGCATVADDRPRPVATVAPVTAGEPESVIERRAAQALRAGKAQEAAALFAELTARSPLDSRRQTLLALAYQSAGDPEAVELALAGYDQALRIEPNAFWAAAMAGRAAYDRGRYDEAARRFAQAALARPSDARALQGLAAAAYMAGDAVLAEAAAERAAALADDPAPARRLAAFAAAGGGDESRARLHLAGLPAPVAAAASNRVDQLIRTSAVDQDATPPAPGAPAAAADQLSVDVAIVLAQNTARERIGLNLLDGLRLQYGYGQQISRRRLERDGVSDRTFERVITDAIGVPQLVYNLNLFNRGGQFYSVVARPTLTAYRGETSEFFVGRTLKVAVAGVNLGQLETIDIGIEMKVTPVEITPDGARIRIETGRSFLTADQAGTFDEALTTFRQRVAATAEVRYGETLLLSGLSESVDDASHSKTPVLGDAPLVGSLFNERTKTQRRDSVLILVTPSPPTSVEGRPWARGEAVERLTRLWTQVIDPSSNGVDAAARLSRVRMFTRMSPGDAPLAWPSPSQVSSEMLSELLAPGTAR